MLSDFAKAYQEELLRTSLQDAATKRINVNIADAGENSKTTQELLTRLGDLLINLGERLKGQSPCPELTHGQA